MDHGRERLLLIMHWPIVGQILRIVCYHENPLWQSSTGHGVELDDSNLLSFLWKYSWCLNRAHKRDLTNTNVNVCKNIASSMASIKKHSNWKFSLNWKKSLELSCLFKKKGEFLQSDFEAKM